MNLYLSIILFLTVLNVNTRAQEANPDGLDGLRSTIPGEPIKDYPIFSIDILRKLNPAMFGGPKAQKKPRKSKSASNPSYEGNDVSKGEIPGIPGKDYPISDLSKFLNKHKNIQHAPSFLVIPNYPKNRLPPRPTNLPTNLPPSKYPTRSNSNSATKNNQGLENAPPLPIEPNCSGGTLEDCIAFCPGEPTSAFQSCVENCDLVC